MKKIFNLVLCFMVITVNTMTSQNKGEIKYKGKVFTVKQLKEDFSLLRKALEEAHPSLYKYTTKSRMDSMFNSVDESITRKMDDLALYRLLVPIFGKIKCGHTRLNPPESIFKYLMEEGKIFPMNVKIINNRVFVTRNFSKDSLFVMGTEIRSINGLSVEKVIDKMLPATFADGYVTTMKYKLIEKEFFFFYFLMVGEPSSFIMDAIDPITHDKFKRTVMAGKIGDRERRKIPLVDLTIFSEYPGTALLSVRSFDDRRYKAANTNYFKFIDSAFAVIKKSNIKKLIIDARGNDGGNPSLVSHLYKQFADTTYTLLNLTEFKTTKRLDYFGDNIDTSDFYRFKVDANNKYRWNDMGNDWYGNYQPLSDNFKGRVYVLMDGGSFSSSGFFGTLIKYYDSAKIIGEEAGGGCYCNDCHGMVALPNSALKANIARCYVTLKIEVSGCEGHGVMPDYPIDQKEEDILKGKDTVLEFALKIED